ncbi:hypothetical protein G9A89_021724 [Geosiphon pyriformis]|nr:hypothetical protein G9A89_021724 [Geosiphon pyriformis]
MFKGKTINGRNVPQNFNAFDQRGNITFNNFEPEKRLNKESEADVSELSGIYFSFEMAPVKSERPTSSEISQSWDTQLSEQFMEGYDLELFSLMQNIPTAPELELFDPTQNISLETFDFQQGDRYFEGENGSSTEEEEDIVLDTSTDALKRFQKTTDNSMQEQEIPLGASTQSLVSKWVGPHLITANKAQVQTVHFIGSEPV